MKSTKQLKLKRKRCFSKIGEITMVNKLLVEKSVSRNQETGAFCVYDRCRRTRLKLTAAKCGPKPQTTDEILLVLVREVIAASPFSSEGYRKILAFPQGQLFECFA
jgi:hypothetical protein